MNPDSVGCTIRSMDKPQQWPKALRITSGKWKNCFLRLVDQMIFLNKSNKLGLAKNSYYLVAFAKLHLFAVMYDPITIGLNSENLKCRINRFCVNEVGLIHVQMSGAIGRLSTKNRPTQKRTMTAGMA